MFTGAFTLLARAIRVDAKHQRAHVIRIASIVVVLGLLIAAHVRNTDTGTPGLAFFKLLATLSIVLTVLAGTGHFANSITEEKEEGTLGLLLLAGMSPLSILFGKSTSRIFSAWMIFLTQLPFALLALTMGGIAPMQVFITYLSLAAFLFMIANIALFVSVISRRSGEALALMALISVLILGGVPWLVATRDRLVSTRYLAKKDTVSQVVDIIKEFDAETSIVHEIGRVLDRRPTLTLFSRQVRYHMLYGCIAFGMAWLTFRRIVWAPDASEPQRGSLPMGSGRFTFWVPRPWANAVMWKDFHFTAGGLIVVLAKMLAMLLFVFLCWRMRRPFQDATGLPFHLLARHSMVLIFTIELLMIASTLFHAEKKWGTLPTLLMLPKSTANLGYSKLIGSLLGSVPTLILLFAVIAIAPGQGKSFWSVVISWPTMIYLCALIFLCHLTVYCSVLVKWGALPLAIGITAVLLTIATPVIGSLMIVIEENYQHEYVKLGPMLYATALSCAFLQFEIARRIQAIASS